MLCADDFDMFETMSAFEVMDKKMDPRVGRKNVTTPQKALSNGKLIMAGDESKFTPEHRLALVFEFINQFATW